MIRCPNCRRTLGGNRPFQVCPGCDFPLAAEYPSAQKDSKDSDAYRSRNREHYLKNLLVCKKCENWTTDSRGLTGCSLHDTCPEKIRSHLLDGGGCLDKQRPKFGPLAPLSAKIVTFHFNPMKYRRLAETYHEWIKTVSQYEILCLELVLDNDRPEIPDSYVMRGTRRDHLLWQKEAMVNYAIFNLCNDVDYVAWVDHDIVFQDARWLEKSIDRIGTTNLLLQPWSRVDYLNLDKKPFRKNESATYKLKVGKPPDSGPGAAWVGRVEVLQSLGGLYERGITGGSDQAWFNAVADLDPKYLQNQHGPKHRAFEENWINSIRGRASWDCLDIQIKHLWHGEFKNRQYRTRDIRLGELGYDPEIHVEKDTNGLLRWTSLAGEELREAVKVFFERRKDDG